jgi:imidazolonepropionase-like amidohydrolase
MIENGIKVIKCGKLIDGTGGEPLENATVIIDGNKVKTVGKDIPIPEGAQFINANGKIVMPGMINSHMHFIGRKNESMMERVIRPRELTLIQSIFDAKTLLDMGFTTVRDCGNGLNSIYLKKSVAEGTLKDIPRIVAAGLDLSQTHGHGDTPFFPPECVDARTYRHAGSYGYGHLICDGVPECIKATRYALRCGADFIKITSTGGVGSQGDFPSDTQFNLDEIKAIVETAAQVGKYVVSHSQNSRGSKNAILGGVKTLEHANETNDEVIALAQEHGVIFVSTLAVCRIIIDQGEKLGMSPWQVAKARTQWDFHIDSYNRMRKAGATLAIGTDFSGSQAMPLGKDAIELELLGKYTDYTPLEIITAATKHGAMACFMGDKTGTIEAGKYADIIVVDGNPLEDITILQDKEKIKMVMLEGKVEVNRGIQINS